MKSILASHARQTWAFVGGGQMASAMIAGLLRAGRPGASILVVEPFEAQRAQLRESFAVEVAERADERLAAADVVVWSVKPQVMRQAIDECRDHLPPALHVSIAAGLPLGCLAQWLGTDRIVRAMPNTSALVGAGVTGMVPADGLSNADRERAAQVLSATGHCFWVESDERLDAVTAVSGSGPAYVFHFLEAFQAAAEAVGFDPREARDLVLRTTAGAVEQARMGDSFALLRAKVTSKRGTTEAALSVLNERRTLEALRDAVRAAYARAGTLSSELANQHS